MLVISPVLLFKIGKLARIEYQTIDRSSNNDMWVKSTQIKHIPINFSKQNEASQNVYIDGKYRKAKCSQTLG